MATTISTQTLAIINANANTLEVSLDGKGHFAGLSNSAKQTLRKLGALKDVLGQNAENFHIVLEQHEPEDGAIIRAGDDCHNSWHVVGIQGINPRSHVIESLRNLTGVEPASQDAKTVTYNAEQLKTIMAALGRDAQGPQR